MLTKAHLDMLYLGLALLIFAFSSVCGVTITEYVTVSDADRNWTESVISCTERSLQIAEDPAFKIGRETHIEVELGEGQKAWMGHFLTFTSFYWYQGCFEVASGNGEGKDLGSATELRTCIEGCGDTPIIGIQQTKCFCLHNLGAYTKAEPTSCDSSCTGNSNETCGGETHMTAYGLVPENNLNITKLLVDAECATLEIHHYGDGRKVPSWIVRDCADELASVCKLNFNNGTEYYEKFTDTMLDWYNAQKACGERGGYLALVDEAVVAELPELAAGAPHWVGLIRSTKWKSATTYNQEKDLLIDCGAIERVVKGNDSVLEWQSAGCGTMQDFICRNDTELITTPVPKTTAAPEKQTSDDSDQDVYIGVGVAVAIVVIGIVVVIVVCLKRSEKAGSQQRYAIQHVGETGRNNTTTMGGQNNVNGIANESVSL